MATSSDKIEKCEVCGGSKAKYTCPKCEVRTCCLTCVNIHKKELDCDGIRDKTKFIPLRSFTDLDVLSDYRLLEEVGRSVDQLKRDPTKKCTRQNTLPLHLNKLRSAAYKRKVNLQFMPQNFSRHKSNTSFLNWKTNELFWRIEWIFPQAEHTKWVTQRALETTRLSTLVEEVLDPVDSLEDRSNVEDLNLRINLRERLQFYRSAGLQGIKVLLKAEKVTKSDTKFYELDVTLTLRENFENKTIIEFPTLCVILKDHGDMYDVIDSEDEEAVDARAEANGSNFTDRRKRKRPNKRLDAKDKNAAVNYFFDADFSGSEDERMITDIPERKESSTFDIPDYDRLVKMEH